MPVQAEFFQDPNFGGRFETFSAPNSRYVWVWFGSDLSNRISSLRATAYGGNNGSVYAFDRRTFLGSYAALHARDGYTSWWNTLNRSTDNKFESAVLINHSSVELPLSAREVVGQAFKEAFDEAAPNRDWYRVKRDREPKIFAHFLPKHAPGRIFLSLQQHLKIEIDWWPDYKAMFRYDVELYINSRGKLRAAVRYFYIDVEGGVLSSEIKGEMRTAISQARRQVNRKMSRLLRPLNFKRTYKDVYLVPGPPPNMNNFGELDNATDDATIVLVSEY